MYENSHLTLVRTVEPAIEPITLSEVKEWLRIDSSDEDTIITKMIKAVRFNAEEYTRKAFITQTWKLTMQDFPRDSDNFIPGFPRLTGRDFIRLPRTPVQSVSSVKYYDNADILQTFSSTNYTVGEDRIYLKGTSTWPSDTREGMSVEITVVSGYGAKTTDVPEDLRQAMIEHVAFKYENRGADKVPDDVKIIYNRYKRISFGRLIG